MPAAAHGGNLETMELLLDMGANVDLEGEGGIYGNVLQAAAPCGNVEAVRLLLDKGAKVNREGGYNGTALQAASHVCHHLVVFLLLYFSIAQGKSLLAPPSSVSLYCC